MISEYGSTYLRSRSRALGTRVLARDSVLWRLDWVLFVTTLALCFLGALLVWSATRGQLLASDTDPSFYLRRQALNIGIGLALAVVATSFDYRLLRAYAPLIYAASCFTLVLVLTPLGVTINGASSWLSLPGPLVFQPSEFAKIALLLLLAMLLGETRDAEHDPRDRDVLQALVVALVPMGLILMQPDLGTSLVFGVMVLGMIAVSGAPRRWPFGLILGVAVAAVVVVRLRLLEPYQIARFTAFARPSSASEAVTYSADQARTAIGSGGLFGKGLFEGSLTGGQFVPEQHSDFIFTVAGEEFGFVGSAVVVALLAVLLWRALRIAINAEDAFGMLVAGGIVCWFGFQVFQNVGMTVGLMPVTGLPLPFISYGGSATMTNMIAVGLLLNVHLSSNRKRSRGRW